MADQAEYAFIKTFVNTISTQPINYGDEYQQPPENSLKKIPVLAAVAVPEPPVRREETAPGSSSITLNLFIKSTKPPITYALSGVHPTDTIADIKQHLSTANPNAPAPDAQRLLLKGKALADNKLLKEYPVKDGDTINLMVKPGVEWNPSAPMQIPGTPAVSLSAPAPKLAASVTGTPSLLQGGSPAVSTGKRHQRIPSVVLSPSPSNEDNDDAQPRKDVLLTLDTTDLGIGSGTGSVPKETLGTYHMTISSPRFWEKLIQFLRMEFTNESDALAAFEDFLAASKGGLTASDIAKIRDHVGVVGMAGT